MFAKYGATYNKRLNGILIYVNGKCRALKNSLRKRISVQRGEIQEEIRFGENQMLSRRDIGCHFIFYVNLSPEMSYICLVNIQHMMFCYETFWV